MRLTLLKESGRFLEKRKPVLNKEFGVGCSVDVVNFILQELWEGFEQWTDIMPQQQQQPQQNGD